jgi:SGNH hydrolase-like domain, acetyltransferase AlgX
VSRWRLVARGALLAGLALTSALATSEVLLRLLRYRSPLLQYLLYLPGEPPHWDRASTLAGLVAIAPFHPPPFREWGPFKLDALGFATPPYARTKAPGTFRILALGDSFTFDSSFVPQAQMWHRLVGEVVARESRRAVEVVNLGMPAVGPSFALRAFEVEGRSLAPDLVLFGLFVGNDLTDEAGARGSVLVRHALTWRLGKQLLRLARQARLGVLPAGTPPGGYEVTGYVYDPEAAWNDTGEFLRIERDALVVFALRRRAEVSGWIGDTVRTTAALDRAVRESGSRLVVVLMPDVLQVDPAVRLAVLGAAAEPAEAYDFDWTQAELARRLAEAGVTVVDLLPAFRAAPSSPRLYRRFDLHWSVVGNAVAAAAIADALAAHDGHAAAAR